MPRFLKRKPSLTVDTKAANGEHVPSSHDDDVFAAIFNANCLDYEDQSAKPLHNRASTHRSLSTSVISQKAIVNTKAAAVEYTPSNHDDDDFAAIFDANSHNYEDRIAEPSHNRATICRSLSTNAIPQRAESTPSPSFSLAEEWSPPQSLPEFSSGRNPVKEELLQAEYEKIREIGRSKGLSEAELDDLFNYNFEHGFPDLRSNFGFGLDPEEDDSAYAGPEIPKFTNDSLLVKKIESLYLRSTYGQDICSTRQIEGIKGLPATEHRQQASLRTVRNSIYLHSNSDISSNRATQPVASAFSSPSSNPSLDHFSMSALLPDSGDAPESPAASFGSTIPTDRHSPVEDGPEVKNWGGQDSEQMNLGVTDLTAPQADPSAEVLSEQSSSDDVYDILPNLPHETWPSPSTAASRDVSKDPNACFEHDVIPLLSSVCYNHSASNACKIVHFRPATMGETCIHRTVPENNSNTSSFAGNTGIMTPPGASSEEEDLSSATESSSLARSVGKDSVSEDPGSSLHDRNTSIDAGASSIAETKPSMRSTKEYSIATNVRGNLSKSSSLAGDDLAVLITRPTITENPDLGRSTHLEFSLPHTIIRTSSLVDNTTGSPATEAQIRTANDINPTGEMGPNKALKKAGDAYRKVKRVFSNENLSPKSRSIAGIVGQPKLQSTSNLSALPDHQVWSDEPLSASPVPPIPRNFMENSLASASAATPLSPARNVVYNSWASPYTTAPSSPTCNVIGNSWDSFSTTAPSSPRAKTSLSKQSSPSASASNTLLGSRISPPTLHDTTNDFALKALANMHDDPDKGLPDKVRKINQLRRFTGTVVQYFDGTTSNGFWRQHPKHNRVWKSKNLRCTVCPKEENCALCKSPCCAYSGASQKIQGKSSLPEERLIAWKLVGAMQGCVANGTDVPTFLKCTTCNKDVCPDCCGVCPVFPCHDRKCRECRADPWSVCEIHGED